MNPPLPIVEPEVNESSPLSTALDAASISESSGILLEIRRPGSASTWISFFVSPHMATLATPGTAKSRGRMLNRAILERSSGSTVLEVIPTCITRLVADTIGYIAGGAAHEGSVGAAAASRSWTS